MAIADNESAHDASAFDVSAYNGSTDDDSAYDLAPLMIGSADHFAPLMIWFCWGWIVWQFNFAAGWG